MKLTYWTILMLMFVATSSFGQEDSTATQQVVVQSDTATNKASKKVKKPFMGGLFIEPEGIEHSPKKAMLLSFAFPGGGQIYNKQYLKVPIVLGAVGGAGYWAYYNTKEYRFFRDLYRARANGLPMAQDTLTDIADNVIIDVRDKSRKRMEQAYFIGIAVYLLNGVEAFTAAHLLNFDISEDLSMEVAPDIYINQSRFQYDVQSVAQPSVGLGISLIIKPNYTIEQPTFQID